MDFVKAIKSFFIRGQKREKDTGALAQPDVALISLRKVNEDEFCFRGMQVRAKGTLPVPAQEVWQSDASRTISDHLAILLTILQEPICDTEMHDTTAKKTSFTEENDTDYDISPISAEIIPTVVEHPPTSGFHSILVDCETQTDCDEINEIEAKVIDLEELLRRGEEEKKHMALRLNDYKITADSLKQEILHQRTLHKEACAKIASMQREMRGLCHTRSVLQTQVDNLKKEMLDSKDKNGQKVKELNKLHCQNIEKLRTFHSILIKNRDEKINDLTSHVHQLECEYEDYKLQIDQYEDQHRETAKEIKQLSFRSSTQEDEIVRLEKANARLKVQVEELEQVTLDLPNYYRLLNVNRDATDAQIKAAYRKRVLEFHPDKVKQLNPDSDEKFCERAKKFTQSLNRANKILQMPRLKFQYDSWLDMVELKKAEERQECYDRMYR